MRSEYLGRCSEDLDREIEPLTSPIEKVFLACMLAGRLWAPPDNGDDYLAVTDTLRDAGLDWDDVSSAIFDQQRFFSYGDNGLIAASTQCWLDLSGRRIRPDFAFVFSGIAEAPEKTATRIVVELDGHDFHERTPEQAQSDKSRDRELQALGWQVLRFTGREVLRDPRQCVQETESLLLAKGILERQRLRRVEIP